MIIAVPIIAEEFEIIKGSQDPYDFEEKEPRLESVSKTIVLYPITIQWIKIWVQPGKHTLITFEHNGFESTVKSSLKREEFEDLLLVNLKDRDNLHPREKEILEYVRTDHPDFLQRDLFDSF